jgi:hypothetical protein
MLEAAQNHHWPSKSEYIRIFLSDCLCSQTKRNKRRLKEWREIAESDICADLYTFGDKIYLTILEIEKDIVHALKVDGKGIDVANVFTVLTDRGNEFDFLDGELKKNIRTASYSSQANGKIERIHMELSAMCRLYLTAPDQIAELCKSGKSNHVVGLLFLIKIFDWKKLILLGIHETMQLVNEIFLVFFL